MAENTAGRLYGLRLSSAWPLHGSLAPAHGAPDVEFIEGDASAFVDAPMSAPHGSSDWFFRSEFKDGSTYLRWTDLFEFIVSPDGKRITCRALAHASQENFQTYLLGQVLSFSLLKQGWEPLHATTIAVGDVAVGLMGD